MKRIKPQRRNTRTATAALYAHERNAVVIASMFFVCAFALYIYFLSASIINVVVRQEIDGEIRSTNIQLTELEGRYIAAKAHITEAAATDKGFVRTSAKTFVSKSSGSVAYTRR